MSILIEGMEIPMDGRILIVFPSGRVLEVSADATQDIFRETQAVHVPPHGRLGDLDALVHDLDDDIENDQRALDEMDFVGKERECVEFNKKCKQNCLRYLSNAPTIIPASEEGE